MFEYEYEVEYEDYDEEGNPILVTEIEVDVWM